MIIILHIVFAGLGLLLLVSGIISIQQECGGINNICPLCEIVAGIIFLFYACLKFL